ncbi:MAG: hypothetical protein KF794_04960 [Xanthobacteraceae bacterium]|nr:hypothetical protein [Xanthobacteraceae bacterium]QYK46044.1 MAG: hypothetical protein KF794_04960 [Xanthobacteraceae bacterium]
MGDYTIIAIILIAVQFLFGYGGALIANAFAGRRLSAVQVLACGVAGALAAIAIVLSALPYFVGLVAAPATAALLVVLWSNFRTA